MTNQVRRAAGDLSPAATKPDKRAQIVLVGLNPAERRTVPSRLFGALAPGAVAIDLPSLMPGDVDGAMVVVSPLFGIGFDAVDVAERLAECGFAGRYVVYTNSIAHGDVIAGEIAAAAPHIDFDVIEMGRGPRLVTS